MSNKYYAGIGSRGTPLLIRQEMQDIASIMSELGYVLRSGGANGADSAFEEKATEKEIILPFNGFNGRKIDNKTYFAGQCGKFERNWVTIVHPNPSAVFANDFATKAHCRNVNQILGLDGKTPVEFVVYWAPLFKGKIKGGTATAVELAHRFDIPTYNLLLDEDATRLLDRIKCLFNKEPA